MIMTNFEQAVVFTAIVCTDETVQVETVLLSGAGS